jgi:hypothetical protein
MRGSETSPSFTVRHSIHIGIKYVFMVCMEKERKERFEIPLIIGTRSYFPTGHKGSHIALLSKVTLKPASRTQVWSCKQSNMMLTKILTIYTAHSSVHPACNSPLQFPISHSHPLPSLHMLTHIHKYRKGTRNINAASATKKNQ